jgi:uncharacterized protein YjiS (DUF1127 family)
LRLVTRPIVTYLKEPSMNTTLIFSGLSAWFSRLLCRWREARRLQRGLAELAAMSAHELRDIGLSHASVAATARRETSCA